MQNYEKIPFRQYIMAKAMHQTKILVSACLMGFNVRYNGSAKALMQKTLQRWQQEDRLVIHCPELAAGLPVPRRPAEIVAGHGADVMREQARIIENDVGKMSPRTTS